MFQIQFIGYIGQDAVIRSHNGDSFVTFSVAVNSVKADKTPQTTWVNCSTKKEELLPYLAKGTLVYIQGTPRVRAYSDKNGDPAAALDMSASKVELLNSKKDVESVQA